MIGFNRLNMMLVSDSYASVDYYDIDIHYELTISSIMNYAYLTINEDMEQLNKYKLSKIEFLYEQKEIAITFLKDF